MSWQTDQLKQDPQAGLSAAAPPAGPLPSGFRNTGGIRAAAGVNQGLAQAGAELGAPTSFDAGKDAPTPIGVIRGMKQTYATDAGGPQLSEFATPLQAQQAWNRDEGNGEYIAPTGPAIDLASAAKINEIQAKGEADARNPYYQSLANNNKTSADAAAEAKSLSQFKAGFQGQFGEVPKPGAEGWSDYQAAHEAARAGGPQAGLDYHATTQQVKGLEPLLTQDNLKAYYPSGTKVPTTQELADLKVQAPDKYREYALTVGNNMKQRGMAPQGSKLNPANWFGPTAPPVAPSTPGVGAVTQPSANPALSAAAEQGEGVSPGLTLPALPALNPNWQVPWAKNKLQQP